MSFPTKRSCPGPRPLRSTSVSLTNMIRSTIGTTCAFGRKPPLSLVRSRHASATKGGHSGANSCQFSSVLALSSSPPPSLPQPMSPPIFSCRNKLTMADFQKPFRVPAMIVWLTRSASRQPVPWEFAL